MHISFLTPQLIKNLCK